MSEFGNLFLNTEVRYFDDDAVALDWLNEVKNLQNKMNTLATGIYWWLQTFQNMLKWPLKRRLNWQALLTQK